MFRAAGPPCSSRLSETVARRRILYPSTLIAAPSVLVIDVPPASRGGGLALNRFYAIIIETENERLELEAYLNTARSEFLSPDLLDHRPSNLRSESILISRYDPPAPGWPWLSVAFWPEASASAAREHGIAMARGCYTMEMFQTAADVDAHCATLIESLGTHRPLSVRLLSTDRIAMEGRA